MNKFKFGIFFVSNKLGHFHCHNGKDENIKDAFFKKCPKMYSLTSGIKERTIWHVFYGEH